METPWDCSNVYQQSKFWPKIRKKIQKLELKIVILQLINSHWHVCLIEVLKSEMMACNVDEDLLMDSTNKPKVTLSKRE